MNYTIVRKDDEISQKVEQLILSKIRIPYDSKNPDIVIAIGGDGTTLKAVHEYEKLIDKVIIFPIHTGHLGFFASFESSEIDEISKMINEQSFDVDELALLRYHIKSKSSTIERGLALNEITIINPTRTLMLDVKINELDFEHFRGTGICISTPAGSTGYNKSLNGAVISQKLQAFQITEIASINSNLYHTLSSPLILTKDDFVEFTSELNKEIWITVDSNCLSTKDFKSLKICLSSKRVRIANHGLSHIDRIKKNFL